ncbi:DUF4974 domain-containing protein [Chitinophaga silvatica]|uniref:DUF4974 domain-containing protein n=1 Tax=Chitinophaga silvatica TaxID=2282649 RepID=A0A3E1Y893_9BACT|nr:DUF4974 domain-containing protein [Chitinophaga silvatica]RFS21376.1 DUF4974 domain-containing protein [Chitinophaga silvatica]
MYQPEPETIRLISNYIQSPQDPALQQQIAELCVSDPELAQYVEEQLMEWLKQGAVLPTPTIPVTSPTDHKQSYSWFRWAIAGVFLLLSGSLFFWYYKHQQQNQLQVYTNTRKDTVIIPLVYQNSIILNKQSAIAYNSKLNGNPAIKMINGDAYIEINRTKQVGVQLDAQTVLYTSKATFNVHKTEDLVQVILVKGLATIVQDDVKEWDLKPNIQIKRQLHKQILQSKVKSLSALAWKTRILNFRDIPLPEALDGINSYFRIEIVIPPSAETLTKRKITADFSNLSISETISSLKKLLKLPIVKERPGKYYITLK